MNRQKLAQTLTIVALAGVVAFLLIRSRGGLDSFTFPTPAGDSAVQSEAQPQDAIYQMLDAAREGDLEKYLDSFGPEMQANLRQAVTEMSRDRFLASIREANEKIKGVAVMEPERVSENEVKAVVEYVYQDRNETQTMTLGRSGERWQILRLDNTQRIQTLIPYGTPVQQQ